MRTISMLFLLAVLCGCVPDGKIGPATAKVSGDQFDPDYKVQGQHNIFNPFGGTIRDFFLRSFIDKKTLTATTQIYADITYTGEWRFYQSATDDTATILSVNVIGRHVGDCMGGCTMNETIGIEVPMSVLAAHIQNGLAVKLAAKSGDSLILEIPASQISEQIFQISRIKLEHGGIATNVPAALPAIQTPDSTAPHGVLFGIKPVDTPASLAAAYGIKPGIGVFVLGVDAGGIAEKSGIKPGDIVTKFNGVDVTSVVQFRTLTPKVTPTTLVQVEIRRANTTLFLNAQF